VPLRDPNRPRREHVVDVEDVGFGGSCGVPPCDHWHLHAVVLKSVASEITITWYPRPPVAVGVCLPSTILQR
jgi:hypothetical protein